MLIKLSNSQIEASRIPGQRSQLRWICRQILFVALISSVLMVHALSSEIGPGLEWNRTFGGLYGDGVWSLQETKDGGYILAGHTATRGEGSDLWIIRTDPKGNPLWNETFGGSGEDIGYFIHKTRDDGFVIAGSTSSYGLGNERLWLIKTDGNGSLSWSRVFGGFVSSSGDGGWSVDEAKEGGYIVAGYTQSFGSGRKDLWLVRTDDQGKEIWDETYGGAEDDVGTSVIQTKDGGFVTAGRTSSYGNGGDDIWLLKVNLHGEEVWSKTFGGQKDDAAFQVVELADGYALVGRTESGTSSMKIILIKTNLEGKKLWERSYRGNAGTSLEPTSDGGFIIAGRIDDKESGRDAFIVKTDSIGREEWSKPFGGARDDIGTSVIESNDSSYIFAGITSSEGYGAEDAWLVKLHRDAKNSINEADLKKSKLILNATLQDESLVSPNSRTNVSKDLAFRITRDVNSNITNDIELDLSQNNSFSNLKAIKAAI